MNPHRMRTALPVGKKRKTKTQDKVYDQPVEGFLSAACKLPKCSVCYSLKCTHDCHRRFNG